jgi:phosphoribosylamine---glycine ligase
MEILVVGGGGREHALVWKLKQSPDCGVIWCAPGNAGIRDLAEIVPIGVDAIDELVEFAQAKKIDLVVVGPEAPLANGLADAMREKGIDVFGPGKLGAQIEGSKSFARNLMDKYGIPSPEFGTFTNPQDAKDFVQSLADKGKQCVIKADGLAAGKGAIVTNDVQEAGAAIDLCMVEKAFGDAGAIVVVEERLRGPEVSILAITDGKHLAILPPSQDHKPIGEGDTGPNTGGMGAYCPVPIVDDALLKEIRDTVLEPAIRGLEAEGAPYSGVLYAGLMLCEDKPYVIEFNCRFGDPETEAVLPAIDIDLLPLLVGAAKGDIGDDQVIPASQYALCVIIASAGYPGAYKKGLTIKGMEGIEEAMDQRAIAFHAGTKLDGDNVVTSGGRVLGVTGLGEDFDDAYDNAYEAVQRIQFDQAYYRKDIGYRVRS